MASALGLNETQLLQYVWWDLMGGGSLAGASTIDNSQFLVGVQPAAYIRQGQR